MNTRTPARSFDLGAVLDGIRNGLGDAESQLLQHFLPQIRILLRRHCASDALTLDRRVAQLAAELLQRVRTHQLADNPTFAHDLRALLSQYYDPPGIPAAFDPAALSGRVPTDRETDALRQAIASALRQLPGAPMREMVIRFYLKQQSPAQICTDLKIEPAVLRQALAELRLRFREALSLRATSPRIH